METSGLVAALGAVYYRTAHPRGLPRRLYAMLRAPRTSYSKCVGEAAWPLHRIGVTRLPLNR